MFKRPASIATLLIAALIALVTAVITVFAVLTDRADKIERHAQLVRTLQFNVEQQVSALTLPMWDLDHAHIQEFMRNGMQNREVVAIVASMPEKRFVLTRDAKWQPIATTTPPSDDTLISAEGLVEHMGERLGVVRVYATPKFMAEDLKARRTNMVIFIVLLDLTLLLGLGLLLWHLMLKPVRAMERFAASVRQGNPAPDQPGKAWFFGELASLNQSIRDMTTMLDTRYKEVQDGKNRLTLAAKAADIGIWDWDIINDHLAWDEQVRIQFGLAPGEYVGTIQTWKERLLPEAMEQANLEFLSVIGGKKEWSLEFPILRPDGSVRFIKGMATSICNAQGQVVRLVGLNFDITDRRKAEDQVRQLNAELEQRVTERTAQLESANAELAHARDLAESATQAKSEFLANVSHEVRTPMNAIVGLTSLALRANLPPKQKRYLVNVKSAADSLLLIINDILDFSKIEAGKLVLEHQDFVLEDVLDKVTSVVALKAQDKGLSFLIDVPPRLVGRHFLGDSLRLQQVLINLCYNAIKFTHRGEVVLRIREADGATLPEQRLRFEVRDTGIGMSREQTEKLFAPFSQVDASSTRMHGGSGLGLAISQQLAHLMRGHITVESWPNGGSVFSFEAELGVSPTEGDRLDASLPLQGLRVLLVQPHERGRDIVSRMLTELGASCETRTPAAPQSAPIGTAPMSFDTVLVDVSHQDGEGFDLIQAIQQSLAAPQPTIWLCTTQADETSALHGAQKGIAGTLYYPILPSALINALGQPPLKASVHQQAPDDSIPSISTLQGRRILLVEDNAINQIVATDFLVDVAGMNLTVAEDGQQALLCLSNGHFDAVLMDVQMPVMDGIQATQLIRLNPSYADLPIIAMTAHAMVRDQQRCLAAGMNDCITKPVEPDTLFAKLAKWLDKRPPIAAGPAVTPATNTSASPSASSLATEAMHCIDFDKGLRRCAKRPELYHKLVIRFLSCRRDDAQEIRAALEQGNTEAAAMIAHQQISTASILGADALSAAARALQLNLMEGPTVDWPHLLEEFDQQLAAVVNALEQHVHESQ